MVNPKDVMYVIGMLLPSSSLVSGESSEPEIIFCSALYFIIKQAISFIPTVSNYFHNGAHKKQKIVEGQA